MPAAGGGFAPNPRAKIDGGSGGDGSSPPALLFLCLATLLRLAVAGLAPLSADEAYYRVWSHALAWGYLDHPPMVALWIRAGTWIAGDTALGVRLLGPLAAASGTVLLARAGMDLALAGGAGAAEARRTGIWAGWLLNGTLVLNAGAVIMTPDTPLLLFWTACLAAVARLVRSGDPRWWWVAGAAAGLALDSKYTAVLLGPALLAWMAAVPGARRWLVCWQLYGAAALALALFAPVLAWNAAHGWASFLRQGGRGGVFHLTEAPRFLGELVAGQAGLATPLLFVLFWLGVARGAGGGLWRQPARGLVVAVTVVPALVFIEHALGDRVQGNWPGVLYPGLALAAALAGVPWRGAAVALGLAMAGALYLQAWAAPVALPRRLDPTLIRLGGWDGLAREVEQARRAAGAAYVVADEYGLASALAFRMDAPVLGAEARWSLFRLPADAAAGAGLLVRSDRRAGAPDAAIWAGAAPAGVAERGRNGIVAETYHLYRVRAPRGVAVVRLPGAQEGRLGAP